MSGTLPCPRCGTETPATPTQIEASKATNLHHRRQVYCAPCLARRSEYSAEVMRELGDVELRPIPQPEPDVLLTKGEGSGVWRQWPVARWGELR